MVRTVKISTYKTWRDTFQDLRAVFDDLGLERGDYAIERHDVGEGATVRWWMPFDDAPHEVSCYSQPTREQNLRVCYMHVEAFQRDHLRGTHAKYRGVTYLLPAPEAEAASGQAPPTPHGSRSDGRSRRGLRNLRAACEMLGVREDADQEIVNAAYRALARRYRDHPNEMTALNDARDFLYARRGWKKPAGETSE